MLAVPGRGECLLEPGAGCVVVLSFGFILLSGPGRPGFPRRSRRAARMDRGHKPDAGDLLRAARKRKGTPTPRALGGDREKISRKPDSRWGPAPGDRGIVGPTG